MTKDKAPRVPREQSEHSAGEKLLAEVKAIVEAAFEERGLLKPPSTDHGRGGSDSGPSSGGPKPN